MHFSIDNQYQELILISKIQEISQRHLLEIIAVKAGIKDVMRIHITNHDEYKALENYCFNNNLNIDHSTFKLKVDWVNDIGDTFLFVVPWDDQSTDQFVAYISKDPKILKRAVSIEVDENHSSSGRLYGYPECCCRSYNDISNGKKWIDLILENSEGLFFEPWANKFSYLVHEFTLFPDYFPCNLSCTGTKSLSMEYYKLGLKNNLKEFVNMQLEMMTGLYFVGDHSVLSFKYFEYNKDYIIVNKSGSFTYGEKVQFFETMKLNIIIKGNNRYVQIKDELYRVLIFESHEEIGNT